MREYFATAAVLILLLAVVGSIILSIVKDKKKGKSLCGSNCGCCPNAAVCHGEGKKIEENGKYSSLK